MSKNNEIKKRVIYLYVCYYWPGLLEDYSSRPTGIASRSSVVLSVEGVLHVLRCCFFESIPRGYNNRGVEKRELSHATTLM